MFLKFAIDITHVKLQVISWSPPVYQSGIGDSVWFSEVSKLAGKKLDLFSCQISIKYDFFFLLWFFTVVKMSLLVF
jgi:hypothetical protein